MGIRRKVVLVTGAAAAAAPVVSLGGAAEAANFTVDNLGDSGPGTLRQAVLDANAAAGPDVIVFDESLVGTIVLTTGDIDITDSVTIQGPGADVITVSGNNASRIFYLYNAADAANDVVISGLTLTDGFDVGQGGAIASWGDNLTLDEMTLTDNESDGEGGGLFFDGNSIGEGDGWVGELVITDSIISGNVARSGGGVYVDDTGGEVTIERTTFLGNDAYYYGGGLAVMYAWHDVNITDSEFLDNDASGGGDDGGAIFFYVADESTATILRSTISGNSATDDGGGIAFGDGEPGYSESESEVPYLGALVIDSSTIDSNDVYYGDGGGIWIDYAADVTIVNSTISGNYADNNGAGVHLEGGVDGRVNILHTTITDNYSNDGGGGVSIEGVETAILHSIVSGNSTDGGQQDLDGYGAIGVYWSLIGDSIALSGADNIYDADPMLAPLADNGGPTETHLPLDGSPALEAGDPAISDPPEFDQRGVARVNGVIEIGSVEVVEGPQPDGFVTAEDTVLNVAAPGVLGNDVVPGGSTATVLTPPTQGNLVLNPDGSFTYTPNANFNGNDSFEYAVVPDQQLGSLDQAMESALVSIVVTPVNDPPAAVNDAIAALAGVGQSVTVKVNDTDPDGDPLTIIAVTQGAKGTVVIEGNTVRYTANPGASGADSFTYTISDGFETATATVNVTITGGRIPDTGSSSWSLVFVAGGLLGAGALLTGASRRRRHA